MLPSTSIPVPAGVSTDTDISVQRACKLIDTIEWFLHRRRLEAGLCEHIQDVWLPIQLAQCQRQPRRSPSHYEHAAWKMKRALSRPPFKTKLISVNHVILGGELLNEPYPLLDSHSSWGLDPAAPRKCWILKRTFLAVFFNAGPYCVTKWFPHVRNLVPPVPFASVRGDFRPKEVVVVRDSRREVVLQERRGVKRHGWVKVFHDELPRDGRFEFYQFDASIDSSGRVVGSKENHVFPLDCGCLADAPGKVGGRCRAGLLVCPEHFEGCPRNSRSARFDWENAPRLRSCTGRCGVVNGMLKFLNWLVTPPGSKGGGSAKEES